MKSGGVFEIPDDAWLSTFLGVAPDEAKPGDGFWAFSVTDSTGTSLKISLHAFERSVLLTLKHKDRELASVSQEGARLLKTIQRDGERWIECDFEWEGAKSHLSAKVAPNIALTWSSLIV
jgi:hypothetical protein